MYVCRWHFGLCSWIFNLKSFDCNQIMVLNFIVKPDLIENYCSKLNELNAQIWMLVVCSVFLNTWAYRICDIITLCVLWIDKWHECICPFIFVQDKHESTLDNIIIIIFQTRRNWKCFVSVSNLLIIWHCACLFKHEC